MKKFIPVLFFTSLLSPLFCQEDFEIFQTEVLSDFISEINEIPNEDESDTTEFLYENVDLNQLKTDENYDSEINDSEQEDRQLADSDFTDDSTDKTEDSQEIDFETSELSELIEEQSFSFENETDDLISGSETEDEEIFADENIPDYGGSENSEIPAEISEDTENLETDDGEEFLSEEEEESGIPYIPLSLPGADRPEVEKFRQMYLQPKWTEYLVKTLESGIDYRLYIRNRISEQQVPFELEYLPVVESNYKTAAKSKSGALGLWQFMENSVKPFLVLNDYVDERLDPWKSTDAAIRKLQDNYRMFGDWLIAIAAYNCGSGAMAKALSKAEEKDFWYLVEHNLIPAQTAQYVPKLLAIADVSINAEYYGINIPNHNEEYESLFNEKNAIFDYVTVSKAYSLKQLSQEIRMDYAELLKLNPSFLMGFTHPSQSSSIRLPAGTENTARAALSKIEPIEFPFKYKVVAGDSLWSISRKYGVKVSQICELNGIDENAILSIGKILYIPSK